MTEVPGFRVLDELFRYPGTTRRVICTNALAFTQWDRLYSQASIPSD